MADKNEYITNGALIKCNQGTMPVPFAIISNPTFKINGVLAATEADKMPYGNIPMFGICQMLTKSNPVPCNPAPLVWQDTYPVKIGGKKTLLFKSCIQCAIGGKMEFVTSGQIPLPSDVKEQLKALKEQTDKEVAEAHVKAKAVGESGIVEGMIPVWGSGRDLVNAIQTGDTLGGVMAAGFLVWDVVSIAVGVVSFGAGTAVMQGVKGILRGGLKSLFKRSAKAVGKAVVKKVVKSKEMAKLIGKNIENLAKLSGKICVTACFPAGTPIAVKDGLKNIEDIKAGDLVWSYNEETGETALKPVLQVIERETDILVQLTIANEIIKTTPEHPFYVNGAWKAAGEIELGDKIQTYSGKNISVDEIGYCADNNLANTEIQHENNEILNDFKRKTSSSQNFQRVFNFEVKDFMTFFAGKLSILVHNSCYKKIFFEAFPHLKGKVVVHHAIEQQILKKWPGVFSKSEMHAIENLRGVPKSLNNSLHLSNIRKEWNQFHMAYKKSNLVPSRKSIEDFAKRIDNKFGHLFNPPI